jgi:hypothetical protein
VIRAVGANAFAVSSQSTAQNSQTEGLALGDLTAARTALEEVAQNGAKLLRLLEEAC